jgi:hypothetical protein
MGTNPLQVYVEPEEYKIGWVHGFYDSIPDDGAYYGDPRTIGCVLSRGVGGSEAVQLYKEGYLAGWAARISADSRRTPCAPVRNSISVLAAS